MKAVIYSEYGPPEVLQVKDIEKPAPSDRELLIRVHAVSVNYGDLTARNFKHITSRQFNMPGFLLFPAKLSFGFHRPKKRVLGSELSGVVEAVGSKVTKFKPGDEVFAYRGMEMGACAEYLCMPEDKPVVFKPSNISHVEAAILPYGGIMAASLLRSVPIQSGQRVLIVGASGDIGSMALQLAKYHGAEVTAVCSAPGAEFVRSLGADQVIDYAREDFTQNGVQYDLIFDVLGRTSFSRCRHSLTPTGCLFYVSFKTKQLAQMLWTSLAGGPKVVCAMAGENPSDLEMIKSLVEAGRIKAVVDRVFLPEQAAAAHRHREKGGRQGGVVIAFE